MTYSSRVLSGRFTPKNPRKYVGDVTDIVFRSGLERTFMIQCDENPAVLKWASESTIIPYISPKDNAPHRYFVDFLIRVRTRDGKDKTFLVEIKPSKYTREPIPRKRKTKKFLAEFVQWQVNQAKWDAARQYCKTRDWEFLIITERDLGIHWS